MLQVELSHSTSAPVRRKILKWFQNDLKMSSEGLLNRMGKTQQYWSNFLNGSKSYAMYRGYQKMAEAYSVSEDQFLKKVEGFIKEDFVDNTDNADPKVAFFADIGVTDKNKQDAIMKMIEAFKDVH